MAEMNRYWAEEALREPYAPQDYRWMDSTRIAGLVLGGVTCAFTTSLLLYAGARDLVDPAPRVTIATFDLEAAAPVSTLPAPGVIKQPAVPPQPPAPPAAAMIVSAGRAAAPMSAAVPASPVSPLAASKPKLQLMPIPSAPAPELAPPPAPAETPERAVSPIPAPKAEANAAIGLSKAAAGKPTDIASGEKLGIREILADGIVMQNGRRVRNGSPLPNGEILVGTDAAKGMAETDRRVLVLTP